MERAREIASLWDWLPAFRTVAETEHLPTASRILNVSPSSLSRAVRLLEEEIGQRLFKREGRSLVLNEKGERLLLAVRDAMRGVHSALELVGQVQFEGIVRAAAEDVWFELIVHGAWKRVVAEHPALKPELVRADPKSLPAMLQRGDVDVAIIDEGSGSDPLVRDLMAELPLSLFVRPGHALLKKRRPTWRDVEAIDYVAAAQFGHAAWPSHRVAPRFVVGTAGAAAALCRRGNAVTILPQVVGRLLGLTRVPIRVPQATPLYLLYRPTLATPGRTEALVAAIKEEAEELD